MKLLFGSIPTLIVHITHTMSKVFMVAINNLTFFKTPKRAIVVFQSLSMIFTNMLASSIVKFQIINRVIFSVVVFMVYYFIWVKKTTQVLFHDKSVFQYIPLFSSKRVLRHFNLNIPVPSTSFTPFPSMTLFQFILSFQSFTYFKFSLGRMCLSFSCKGKFHKMGSLLIGFIHNSFIIPRRFVYVKV